MTTGDKIDTKDTGERVEEADKVGTREAESPQEVLARLQQEAAIFDRQNLDAVMALIKRHENLLRDKSTPGPLKREIVANLLPLRAVRKELKAKLEAETPPPELEEPKEVALDQRLHDESIFPQAEREAFLAEFQHMPHSLKNQYAQRLTRAIGERDEASSVTSLRGATFEMTRINAVMRQKLEEITDAITPVQLRYMGYSRKETSFSDPPNKKRKE